MKIKIRKTTLLLLTALTLTGCDEEKLSDRSVIDDGKQQIETTQLDNWILDNITKPYGIEVIYRWEKNTGSTGTFIYPPKLENVRAILEAVRELGLETYRLKEVGGADFLLGRRPSSCISMAVEIPMRTGWSASIIRSSRQRRCACTM